MFLTRTSVSSLAGLPCVGYSGVCFPLRGEVLVCGCLPSCVPRFPSSLALFLFGSCPFFAIQSSCCGRHGFLGPCVRCSFIWAPGVAGLWAPGLICSLSWSGLGVSCISVVVLWAPAPQVGFGGSLPIALGGHGRPLRSPRLRGVLDASPALVPQLLLTYSGVSGVGFLAGDCASSFGLFPAACDLFWCQWYVWAGCVVAWMTFLGTIGLRWVFFSPVLLLLQGAVFGPSGSAGLRLLLLGLRRSILGVACCLPPFWLLFLAGLLVSVWCGLLRVAWLRSCCSPGLPHGAVLGVRCVDCRFFGFCL